MNILKLAKVIGTGSQISYCPQMYKSQQLQMIIFSLGIVILTMPPLNIESHMMCADTRIAAQSLLVILW